MTLRLAIALSVALVVVAWWLTGQVRRYALANQIMDTPNERSSHVVATPRGGGVAIVLATLAALLVLGSLGELTWRHVWGLAGGGVVVAAIGVVDDRRHVAPQWRLLGHFGAAAWLLAWQGGVPAMRVMGMQVEPSVLGNVVAAVYLVWLLNLTNFMDGIDGIAGLETVTVCVGGALLYAVAAPGGTEWLAPVALASATLGFLAWNWPPARIFMGDVGSGFLGFFLGAFSLQASHTDTTLFWGWVILFGVFVVDATVTLLRRLAYRERIYVAHRSHAYQHAAQRCRAHRPVTLAVGAINVFWLLPVALLVAVGALDGLAGVALAYAPLIGVALWLGAGKRAPG